MERTAGISKGTLREGFRFLRLLWDMRLSIKPRGGALGVRSRPAGEATQPSPGSGSTQDARAELDVRPMTADTVEMDPASSDAA